MSLTIREGWTERIRYQLFRDGVAIDLSGMSVALVGQVITGSAKTFAGTVGVDTPATGIVYLDPAPGDLVESESPLQLRWKVTDSTGKVVYFPRLTPEQWTVQIP